MFHCSYMVNKSDSSFKLHKNQWNRSQNKFWNKNPVKHIKKKQKKRRKGPQAPELKLLFLNFIFFLLFFLYFLIFRITYTSKGERIKKYYRSWGVQEEDLEMSNSSWDLSCNLMVRLAVLFTTTKSILCCYYLNKIMCTTFVHTH